MIYDRELELAVTAATRAGARLRELMQGEIPILSQIGRDIKLQADQDAEAIILEVLAESGFPVLAEESGEHGAVGGDQPAWIVDPLDGTLNFSRRLPICCVSIALSVGMQPVLGVIYDFNRDELFTGFASGGAWLNGLPITVSAATSAEKAMLCTGLPTRRAFDHASIDRFVHETLRFKKVRLLGSAALMLAYVACARVDAYAEDGTMYWDVAAGVAIIAGAGGFVHMEDSSVAAWCRNVRCGASAALWPDLTGGAANAASPGSN
ncbi:MAG: inositol monophosphatase [Candidatus Hydrogenedentes bacterium]|nr:inositol monophosphatase [Candidatus Hydrogenedentota bacterium]